MFELSQNKFFIKGESGIKYSYNNGNIAADPLLASTNFLNALEKMPTLIEKYEKDNEKISKDIPVLREVLDGSWKKDKELKELKAELVILDCQILLSLKPIEQSEQPTDNDQNITEREHSDDIPQEQIVVE